MKHICLTLLLILAATIGGKAADCELNIAVVPPEAGEKLPQAVAEKLTGRLTAMLSGSGIAASAEDSQFFFTGRFDNAYFERTSGPQQREVINTTLTLYIGDADGKKIFASKTFDLKGVGRSEEQAYIKAMSSLNAGRRDIASFLADGKAKIIDYFDKNYQSYITKATTAMNQRNYDEALYYALQIPKCCVGFNQAQSLALQIYDHQVDYLSDRLLAQAKAAFGADPTASGAAEAFGFISQIDPNASCYAQAMAYADSMQKTVKSQWEFENIQKYKDELALRKQRMNNQAEIEKARIESAKAIGVAWAKAQPTTRIYYRWY